MDADITIKNYRRFSHQSPALISLRDGLTAFIGVNNAGKSSLLRFFYDFRDLFGTLASLSNLVSSLEREIGFPYSRGIKDSPEVFSISTGNNDDLEIEFLFNLRANAVSPSPRGLRVTVRRDSSSFRTSVHMRDGRVLPTTRQSYSVADATIKSGDETVGDFSSVVDFFSSLTQTVYIGPLRGAINALQQEPYFDINIGREFIAEWRQMKTGNSKRNTEMAISVTDSIQEIFGFESLEINASDDGTTLLCIINGKSFRLNEIGSGMGQFIMVLATAAFRRPNYVLIDEPELGLHPSLQLRFLAALALLAKNGVLFATHNIGLARAAERIYSVLPVNTWESKAFPFEATPRLSELLGELSYLGYKALGYERILLVEGSTELRTVSVLLRRFGTDHKVVPLSMNGANLINGTEDARVQLEEVRRISNNVFALFDSERTAEGNPLGDERQGF